MIYIWMIAISLAVIYLFYIVSTLMDSIKIITEQMANVLKVIDHNAKVLNDNVKILNKLVSIEKIEEPKEEKPKTTKKKTTKKDAA